MIFMIKFFMPKFNEKSRYSYYIVSKEHSKNVVRTLHYLTSYNYIIKEDTINSNGVQAYRLEGKETNNTDIHQRVELSKNYAYTKTTANIELSSYDVVMDELENLALNVKAKYITLIKKFINEQCIIKSFDDSKKTIDFCTDNKRKQLFFMTMKSQTYLSDKYINQIYNQLHSRVIFRYFQELYSNPTTVEVVGNKIKPIILDEIQELKIIQEYINRIKWIFDETILEELRKKREQYIQDEIDRKKYLVAIRDIDVVNSFFNFNMVLDTDDRLYKDAIQILFEGANALLEVERYYNYIEVDWTYEISQEAEQWYEDEQNSYTLTVNDFAVKYIKEYNEKYSNKYSIIYEAQNSKKDLQYGDEDYGDIVDRETYNDESNSDDVRESSLSFGKQWENTFKYLDNNLRSGESDENKYYQLVNLANQIKKEYNELLKNDPNFFSKTGKVVRNKYYRTIDEDYIERIKKQSPNATLQEVRKVKFKLMKTNREKWELIYKIANIPLIKKIDLFDIETLTFLNMDDCPF